MSWISLIWNAIRLALGAIRRNKTRAGLTVLGILIGVAAVVTVTGLASGASGEVGGQLDSFSANAFWISPETTQTSGARSKATGRLTESDGRAVAREAVSITMVAPYLQTTGQVVYGDKNVQTSIYGAGLAYFPIRKWKVGKGELWQESDEIIKSKVCLLGTTVATALFGTDDAVGRTIRIGRAPFRVIGVFESRGSSLFGDDQDDRVMMPPGTYRAHVSPTSPGRVDSLVAGSTSPETTARAEAQITSILRQRHHIPDGQQLDFRTSSQAELRQTQQGITLVLSALLLGVAAISLIVGGIGVMNIMLVSVAERTREIGIRMSIGARERDILLQFLIEAIVLSVIGGLLGAMLGMGATFGLGQLLGWRMVPSPVALGLAIATSGGIGVTFGFFPARRAAKMDPIDALRTE
jgi:putative ABC transport system permease protein